jgi:ABC-type multidrug transport system ATPase subunit
MYLPFTQSFNKRDGEEAAAKWYLRGYHCNIIHIYYSAGSIQTTRKGVMRMMDAWNQTKALTLKNLTLQRRQWKTNLCQLFLPIVCLLCIFILNIIVTHVENEVNKTFTPYFANPPNQTTFDGIIFTLNELYATEQKSDFNASSEPFTVQYDPPQFIYVSYDETNISASVLGTLNMNGTGSGFLGQMYSLTRLLAIDINTSWAPPSTWSASNSLSEIRARSASNIEKIHVPYAVIESSGDAINSILYNFAQAGVQQLSAGAFKFKQLNLDPNSPSISYTVQSDDLGETKFCATVNLLAGRVNCSDLLFPEMATSVHDTALQIMTKGQFGIIGSSAQIPYWVTPPQVFSAATILGVFFFPLVLSLLLPVFTYTIVLEKEYKMREMMKLMGMRMSYYWINTYIFQYLLYILSAIIFVILCFLFRFNIVTTTSPLIWIIMLIGWGFTLVSFGFLLSSILRTTLVSVVAAYIIVLIGPLFATIMMTTGVIRSGVWLWKLILIVFPFPIVNIVYSATLDCWTNTKCYTTSKDLVNMDIGMATIALFVDAAIYLLLALYLDRVLPQTWGVAEKPWFPIEWIWKNRLFQRKKAQIHASKAVVDQTGDTNDIHINVGQSINDEEVLQMIKDIENGVYTKDNSGVYIRNLTKEYEGYPLINFLKSKITGKPVATNAAVQNLSLAIGKSECFGLLGMNGAGKSTTMNILSGIIYKTSGDAYINGNDIDSDMQIIRKQFGLCPQFDVLYEDLTCEEHLKFYARIKGVKNVTEEVNYLLDKVQLVEKRSVLAKSLSGGMRRRLSIALSLVGNPTTIMLDEPTTGLDPSTKRHLWDLIIEAKKNKCVILTTHSLEEADVLCDRIGIMSRGRLKSLGTSVSLKTRYGKGYGISISFNPQDKEVANAFLKTLISEAQLHTEFVGNSIYEVARKYVKVSELFKKMEQEKASHGITEWSINLSSLEDVFLTIVRADGAKQVDESSTRSTCQIM